MDYDNMQYFVKNKGIQKKIGRDLRFLKVVFHQSFMFNKSLKTTGSVTSF